MYNLPVRGDVTPSRIYSKSVLKRLATPIPGEEEAFIHFTLNSFKDLVSKYGVDNVLCLMDDETWFKLFKSFAECMPNGIDHAENKSSSL